MKAILVLFILFVGGFAFGQNIPVILSNTTNEIRANSILLQVINDDYDALIAYSRSCYWGEGVKYTVAGLSDGKWTMFECFVRFKGQSKTIENIKRTKEKRLKIQSDSIIHVLSFWTMYNFWQLDNDSLNIKNMKTNDSTTVIMDITDGCRDQFELFLNGEYRIISSYEPEGFQEFIPIRQRAYFILCRDEYLRLLEN